MSRVAQKPNSHRRDGILLRVTGRRPVGIRPQAFIEIAAVQVNQVVGLFHDLLPHRPRRALGLHSVGIARIETVHALAVHRVHMRHLLFK
jgi:hypothetical protein